MVAWSCGDSSVVTAVSDSSLCVWCPDTSRLLQRLQVTNCRMWRRYFHCKISDQGHTDEVYVLEPHPELPHILLSGAHDGNLIIWDLVQNTQLFRHHNIMEGQVMSV